MDDKIARSAPQFNPPADQTERRFIDRYGRTHSDAILRNWSTAAQKAMGIRETSR
jgi:hypothetical protein